MKKKKAIYPHLSGTVVEILWTVAAAIEEPFVTINMVHDKYTTMLKEGKVQEIKWGRDPLKNQISKFLIYLEKLELFSRPRRGVYINKDKVKDYTVNRLNKEYEAFYKKYLKSFDTPERHHHMSVAQRNRADRKLKAPVVIEEPKSERIEPRPDVYERIEKSRQEIMELIAKNKKNKLENQQQDKGVQRTPTRQDEINTIKFYIHEIERFLGQIELNLEHLK